MPDFAEFSTSNLHQPFKFIWKFSFLGNLFLGCSFQFLMFLNLVFLRMYQNCHSSVFCRHVNIQNILYINYFVFHFFFDKQGHKNGEVSTDKGTIVIVFCYPNLIYQDERFSLFHTGIFFDLQAGILSFTNKAFCMSTSNILLLWQLDILY